MIALARAVNAAFFVLVAAYCFLAASPFAFEQFIKPSVLPLLTDFVRLSPILFWLMWLIALFTLLPQLRRWPRSRSSLVYVVAMGAAGVAIAIWRPLGAVANDARAVVAGVAGLAWLVSLTLVDYRTRQLPPLAPSSAGRALVACLAAGVVVWAAYALTVPFRLQQVVGVDLTPRAIALSSGAALVAELALFTIVFLVALTAIRLAAALRSPVVEYWLFVVALGIAVAAVLYFLVCGALSFTGIRAWVASAALGVGVAAAWADLALVRAREADHHEPVEALEFFFGAIAGSGSRAFALGVLAMVPIAAYWLAGAVRQLDWDFLLQKLGVIVVCAMTLAACHAVVRVRRRVSDLTLALVPIVVLAIAVGVPSISLEAAASGYEAVDPSFRLLRDARAARSSETADYYAYLRARTLVSADRVAPIETDFVSPLGPAAHRPPNVFLLVVDSLRRDYLSPYNPQVTFTPNIARLAAESDVFDRAFTRYAGTYLSVESIWAGGLPFHAAEQPAFERRNTLRKLLAANGYRTLMTRDNVVAELMPESDDVVALERGRKQMEIQACSTLGELESVLAAHDRRRPVFFWSLPQDVHLGVLTGISVPAGERDAYSGFFDKAASQLRRLDACVGRLVDFLKRTDLYDDSIIILTADHGDLYGVDGRWGHANLLYADVMRVPLVVRVPPRLRAGLAPNVQDVAFLTDLTPTLYGLLGYAPKDLGPLFGRPLFAGAGAELSSRRADDFLVASAYGAVYGVLRENGRRLYVVDTIEGREYEQEIGGPSTRDFDVTPEVTRSSRALIRREIDRLAALYRFQP